MWRRVGEIGHKSKPDAQKGEHDEADKRYILPPMPSYSHGVDGPGGG